MKKWFARLRHRKEPREQLMFTVLAIGLAACSAASIADDQRADLEQRFRDGWTEGKIETIYLLNPYLGSFGLDVEAHGSALILTGEVDDAIDRALAEAIAQGLEGIDSIDNRIVIVAAKSESVVDQPDAERDFTHERDFTQKLQDITTTTLVKGKLLHSPYIEGLDISVETLNGKVTLQGPVDSGAAKDLAWRLAKNTHGVVAVDNRLEVRTAPASEAAPAQ